MPLIESTTTFEAVRLLLRNDGGHIIVTFREKGSSCHDGPSKTAELSKVETYEQKPHDSILTSSTFSSLASFDDNQSVEQADHVPFLNDKDPLTLQDINTVVDLMYIHFPVPRKVVLKPLQ